MANEAAVEAREYYDLLRAVCRAEAPSWKGAYRQMRTLLEMLCHTQTEDGSLQMTDLAARINYVGAKRSGNACFAMPRRWPSSSDA